MKNLILIHGATQQSVEETLRQMAKGMDYEGEDITSLRLFATREATTFALRPNRLCLEWNYVGLCHNLIYAFDTKPQVRLEAWFMPEEDYTGNLPCNKMLYVVFGTPAQDDFCLVDKKGNRYLMADAVDQESGAECFQVVQSGTATYKPYPKLQLTPVANIAVGKQSLRRRLFNLWSWLADKGIITLLVVLVICALAILGICAGWDFSETLLPFSLPSWLPYVVFASAGFVFSVLMVIFKGFNFWEHFLGLFAINTGAAALAIGVVMTLVFSVNWWFESSEPVYGTGVVTEVEARGKSGEVPNYSYHVDVSTPYKGKILIRMYHDDSYDYGDTVAVVFHRGLYSLYHAERIELSQP